MRGSDRQYLRSRKPLQPDALPHPVTLVDLFCGCGGLTLGVGEAARSIGRGLDVRLAAELDVEFAETYRANFALAADRMISDVTRHFGVRLDRAHSPAEALAKKRVGVLDILVGGPPCQGHSTLNNHTRGDDPKNRLYMRMVRAAQVLEPRVVLLENVPAIERDSGRVVERAREAFDTMGYRVESAVHSLAEIGVPQLRSRHVLVARRDSAADLATALGLGRVADHRDLAWAIRDLEDASGGEFNTAAVLSTENFHRARFLLDRDVFDLPNRLRPACQRSHHKYKSMYGRLDWTKPAQTITSGFGSPGQGRYLHPSRLRTLTPHEAARLQFFPDWFDFTLAGGRRHVARAIGNAVPPKLSFVLALHALRLGPVVPRARARKNGGTT